MQERIAAMRTAWKKPDRNNEQILQQYIASAISDGAAFEDIEGGVRNWTRYYQAKGWAYCPVSISEFIRGQNWKTLTPDSKPFEWPASPEYVAEIQRQYDEMREELKKKGQL